MLIMTYLLLLIVCFVGLFVLMMTNQKHRAKFRHRYSQTTLKRLGCIIIASSGVLSVVSGALLGHIVYIVMAWCMIMSLAAGVIYIGLMIYELKQS